MQYPNQTEIDQLSTLFERINLSVSSGFNANNYSLNLEYLFTIEY